MKGALMVADTKDIKLKPDGKLDDCEARRRLNRVWYEWPDPAVFDIEAQALFTNHPEWGSNPAVIYYINRLKEPTTDAELETERDIPKVVSLTDVVTETVKWLWFPYIPIGKLTLFEGDPGIGKSWVCLAIATAVSLGAPLPGQAETLNGPVLLASAEDGLGDTIKPRLEGMRANLDSIHAIDGLLTLDQSGFELLETYITETVPTLLIIDPLVAYLSGDMDINRANQVRWGTARLAKLAEKYGIAVLAVRHLTKGGSLKPIYRGLGSIDFTASARSVLLAGCDPNNTNTRGLVHIKSNLAKIGDPIGFELRDDGYFWTDHSDLTSEKILAGQKDEYNTPGKQAESFLTDYLSNGAVESGEIVDAAKAQAINEKTLRRMKDNLKIVVFREGEKGKRGGGKWYWKLPD